jgi:riboflavin synthase
VQGHVDGTTEVVAVELRDAHRQLDVALPVAWRGSVVEKGSVAIDGVSLTVAGLEGTTLRVGLVPHTLAVTTLGALGVGDRVNVELDVLAKYVERQLAFRGVA